MKKYFFLCMCAMLLGGCSSKEPKEVICSGYLNGIQMETRLQARGDNVFKETYQETMDLSNMGYDSRQFNEEQKQEVISLVSSQKYDTAKFQDIPGVDLTAELEGNNFILTLQIDYETADMNDLIELHLIESNGNLSSNISLEKTVEGYEQIGLICK